MKFEGLAVRAFLVLLIGLLWFAPLQAREHQSAKEVALEQLPREAQQTLDLIRQGGPFPYAQDGTVFGNRERLLPAKERGYYREYTVRTPGERSRGARRIVAGAGPQKDVRRSGEYWYTDDHYQSFRRIRE